MHFRVQVCPTHPNLEYIWKQDSPIEWRWQQDVRTQENCTCSCIVKGGCRLLGRRDSNVCFCILPKPICQLASLFLKYKLCVPSNEMERKPLPCVEVRAKRVHDTVDRRHASVRRRNMLSSFWNLEFSKKVRLSAAKLNAKWECCDEEEENGFWNVAVRTKSAHGFLWTPTISPNYRKQAILLPYAIDMLCIARLTICSRHFKERIPRNRFRWELKSNVCLLRIGLIPKKRRKSNIKFSIWNSWSDAGTLCENVRRTRRRAGFVYLFIIWLEVANNSQACVSQQRMDYSVMWSGEARWVWMGWAGSMSCMKWWNRNANQMYCSCTVKYSK